MAISKERKAFFDAVLEYHAENATDVRFYRTSLEEYVEAQGGSRWDVTEEVHEDFKAYRLSLKPSGFTIPD